MDFSKEYIKLCGLATELQKHIGVQNEPTKDEDGNAIVRVTFSDSILERDRIKQGRFLADRGIFILFPYSKTGESLVVDRFDKVFYRQPVVAWLPRFEDLRELSNLDWQSFDKLCDETIEEHKQKFPGNYTKETAAVLTVMKKRYKKVWMGVGFVEFVEAPKESVVMTTDSIKKKDS